MCKHERFQAQVNVFNLHEQDDETKQITSRTADITITCMDCGTPMEFIGVPGGVSPLQPTVSFDGTQLRTPIIPQDKKPEMNKNVN